MASAPRPPDQPSARLVSPLPRRISSDVEREGREERRFYVWERGRREGDKGEGVCMDLQKFIINHIEKKFWIQNKGTNLSISGCITDQ